MRSRGWSVGFVSSLMVVVLFFAGGWSGLAEDAGGVVEVPLGLHVDDALVDGALGYEVLDAWFTELTFDGAEYAGFVGSLFVKRDDEFLYVALHVELDRDLQDVEVFLAFDAVGDGTLYDRGDDIAIVAVDVSRGSAVREGVDFAYRGVYQFVRDATLGGTDDVLAAATLTDRTLVAEFIRPLDSGDRKGMDAALSTGGPILVGIGFTGTGSAIEATWSGWIELTDVETAIRDARCDFAEDDAAEAPPVPAAPPPQGPLPPPPDPQICGAAEREEHAYRSEHWNLDVIVTRGRNAKGGLETTFTDITLRITRYKERNRGPCGLDAGHAGPHQPWTWSGWEEDGFRAEVIRTTTTIGGWPVSMSPSYFERWLVPAWYSRLQAMDLGYLRWVPPFSYDHYDKVVNEKLKDM